MTLFARIKISLFVFVRVSLFNLNVFHISVVITLIIMCEKTKFWSSGYCIFYFLFIFTY